MRFIVQIQRQFRHAQSLACLLGTVGKTKKSETILFAELVQQFILWKNRWHERRARHLECHEGWGTGLSGAQLACGKSGLATSKRGAANFGVRAIATTCKTVSPPPAECMRVNPWCPVGGRGFGVRNSGSDSSHYRKGRVKLVVIHYSRSV